MNRGEKAFFALADIYGGGGQALIGVIYFFFLINVVKISPILAGAVTLISEIWDAISDPLMGVISDNTKSKMGRRRPYVLLGGCLLALAFALASAAFLASSLARSAPVSLVLSAHFMNSIRT